MLQEGTLWEMAGKARVITLIGAGGKTTTLLGLAEEISACGFPVVMTTTTKVYPVMSGQAWRNRKFPPPLGADLSFWYAEPEKNTGKWIGPAKADVELGIADDFPAVSAERLQTNSLARCWLIEGDGARGKKLKCWADHEPQIPEQTECVVLLLDAGLWGGMLASDEVHHPERCSSLIGRNFTAELFWRYWQESPFFRRDAAARAPAWVVLFNLRDESKEGPQGILAPLSLFTPQIRLPWRIAAGNVRTGKVQWLDLP